MAFTWHGNENEVVWESEIVRYYFTSSQEVEENMPHGKVLRIKVGTRVKISKAEAAKAVKAGFHVFDISNWDPSTKKYGWIKATVYGTVDKQVERRECRNAQIQPDEFSRKKKVDIIPPV